MCAAPLSWANASARQNSARSSATFSRSQVARCSLPELGWTAWPETKSSVYTYPFSRDNTLSARPGLALWVPQQFLAGTVAMVFTLFGLSMLLAKADETHDEVTERSGTGIFVAALLMIFLAEMSDKTQIAVAAMASTFPVIPVWIGATLPLMATSVLGIIAGRSLLRRVSLLRFHQIAGVFFLILAVFAFNKAFE